ncbi:DUF2357 domain-containing protein [Methanobacterium sp.]|uniref:DUF2357 domain-containing protein n=1 Tax=Methanobacterium sp. TaxID=2164 RepID=UPI0031580991
MGYKKVCIPLYHKEEAIGILKVISTRTSDSSILDEKDFKLNKFQIENPDTETPIQICDLGNGPIIMLLEETQYQIVFKSSSDYTGIKIIPFVQNKINSEFKVLETEFKTEKTGILNFGSYAGKSFFDVEVDGKNSKKVSFEVRSKKIDYNNEYIKMLSYLSMAISGILFYQNSPLFQKHYFNNKSRKTFYEDYIFLEYLFLEENLPYAYEYIRKNIYTNLKEDLETVPTAFASNLGYAGMVNIICNPESLYETDETPFNWPQSMKNFVPDNITQPFYEESVDTPENRLLKYFLELLDMLIQKLKIEVNNEFSNNLIKDRLGIFEDKIQEYLSDGWLEDVSNLDQVPMNSQVLQKKEGYRDIFKYYLNFDFGFRPVWKEMDDLIDGYERKLNELYELWCYFKLLKIMEKLSRQKIDYNDIFYVDYSSWSIELKKGLNSIQEFYIGVENQKIKVKLAYNLSFSRKNNLKSYSLGLKPDYTLIIDINGEKKLLHFDAKYKSKGITENDELYRKKIYKEEDVHKMHTYKDAILNSLGSYVIYPGNGNSVIFPQGSSEIPSVGAFPLTPGNSFKQEEELANHIFKFIEEIYNELKN